MVPFQPIQWTGRAVPYFYLTSQTNCKTTLILLKLSPWLCITNGVWKMAPAFSCIFSCLLLTAKVVWYRYIIHMCWISTLYSLVADLQRVHRLWLATDQVVYHICKEYVYKNFLQNDLNIFLNIYQQRFWSPDEFSLPIVIQYLKLCLWLCRFLQNLSNRPQEVEEKFESVFPGEGGLMKPSWNSFVIICKLQV